ncbi:MAG TPA: DUF4928 family protein [Candidatus Paceibacterota bacterium]|nr:DUF4928 family protein [Verrucomicrobiota bacterium]HSA11598.1 DUF4928 family protein [Candidatus Paceibacterota bacterium]
MLAFARFHSANFPAKPPSFKTIFRTSNRFGGNSMAFNDESCYGPRVSVDVGKKLNASQPRVAEFFAGIGLMRLGLQGAGWRVVYANDLDPDKEEMYSHHFPDAPEHFHLEDVHKVAKIAGEKIPDIDLATASFPCNDLSLAGAMEGLGGKQSSAFWGFIKVLENLGERRPKLVLLENVLGFLTSHKGGDFRKAMLALNSLGYAVDPFIMNAAWFVPQSRQRLFVVGKRGAQSNVNFTDSILRPPALAKFIKANKSIRWAIADLPTPPQLKVRLEDILQPLPHTSKQWWSTDRVEYFLNQLSEKHAALAAQLKGQRNYTYGTAFRRIRNKRSMAELRTDGIAGCLRTPRGGSGRQIVFKAGKGEFYVRLMTPRECARLMGADEFKIDVPLNQALFGFGDAVCVPAVKWIAENYLNKCLEPQQNGKPIAQSKAQKVTTRDTRMKDQVLRAFEAWFAALPVYPESCGPARGTIAAALHVLELCKTNYCLNLDSYRTAHGKAQIRGLSPKKVQGILAGFDEHRIYLKETGRTNRGGPGDIGTMLDALRPFELERLPTEERNEILKSLQGFLVERVKDWHNQQRLEPSFDPTKTTWQFVADLLTKAREKGKDRILSQHLVGAKLALRFPTMTIQNFSYSTADNQLGRAGDFHVGDTAFHVTVSTGAGGQGSGVFQRCLENIQQGIRVYVIVPAGKLTAARTLAAEAAEGKISVESIESFVSQNMEEIAEFSGEHRKDRLRALLEKYNERVGAVETDKSLLINIPPNLLP